MKKSYWIFACIALPLAAWIVSSPTNWALAGFWQWRRDGILVSGLIAFALCSACMVLATRWGWLERRLGGLDRMYLLHKGLGIAAAALVFTHWMAEQVPKWLVQAGWLTRPVRAGSGPGVQTWLDALRGPASSIGEWIAYLTLALVLIALTRWVPYHWFRRLHKVLPFAFLAMVFHAVVLLPRGLWLTPAGLMLAVCASAGTVAALVVLAGRIGQARRHTGTVAAVRALGDDALEVECAVNGKGLRHHAGQFVIARFAGSRDPHPFTIASGGTDPHRLRLCIKALGDDTRAFVRELTAGAPVALEGPYGRFDFQRSHGGDQVWIGAGIGITPFLARLEALAAHPALPRPARLYFCAPEAHPLAARVRALCRQAGVDCQLVDATRDGPLQLHHAMTPVDNHHRASLWFCGPQRFGDALERAWRAAGLRPSRFHREHFAFR
ncbi:MAG: ferric reductase-like transmembrane domain-containing protein [Burkholderiaceae bacterium]|jgi:predicted ferric reductase|nr:ferric reductase-like transmembrane domain-containing protein [Burkholderiaceae bacterium]